MNRDIQKCDDDIIEMKRLIKQKLIADTDILEALNNPDIPLDSPDEFLDVNILGLLEFLRLRTLFEILFVLRLMISSQVTILTLKYSKFNSAVFATLTI